jgi:hypothetical protein
MDIQTDTYQVVLMTSATSASIRDQCSADAEDIRVLDAYTDRIQKQYKNVSNNLMGPLLSLVLWELP